MNFSRYCSLYSRFHGATSYRTAQDIIILDLAEEPFDNWILLRMFQFDDIHMRPENAFVKALPMFLQSQSPLTVFCQNDTWIALLGHEKYIAPILSEHANFQLYATPYFVRQPSTLADHMQTHHSDTAFRYKNCIVYLDGQDLPYPGGCYFDSSTVTSSSLYRICVLSREPQDQALLVASEWKSRRDVITLPFPTTDANAIPAMISFPLAQSPYLSNERILSTGNIQKRLSLYQPQCLLQDILLSYRRNKQIATIENLGLIVEWPFNVPFEGTRSNVADRCSTTAPRQFAAVVVNALHPKRVLLVRYPYEVYTEYDAVPAIPYIVVHFTSTVLKLPPEMEKVSVDSTVIGYKYENGFYCFSYPLLEGRPTEHKSRNMDCVLTAPKKFHPDDEVTYAYKLNDHWTVYRVHTKTGLFHGWRVEKTVHHKKTPVETVPEANVLPTLVSKWLEMFRLHDESAKPIDVKMLQMALTLARHKICFTTKIGSSKQTNEIVVTDRDITITLGSEEIKFINSRRADTGPDWIDEEEDNQGEKCRIM